MSKTVIKIKKKKKQPKGDIDFNDSGNKDVFNIFQDTMSMNGSMSSFKIIYPKYIQYTKQCARYLILYKMFSKHELMDNFAIERQNLIDYAVRVENDIKNIFTFQSLNYPPTEANKIQGEILNYDAVPEAEISEFTNFYDTIRDCELVQQMIATCNNLISHKKSFCDINNMNPKFLYNISGVDYSPVSELNLNFKSIYINDLTSTESQKVIMAILNKTYDITHEVYSLSVSPDIDVNDFVRVVRDSIGELKSTIPRCDAAFRKIEESIGMLKDNFSDYYKDFRMSGNPTVIMENFVIDVSKSTKANAKIAFQFTKIIRHYRKITATKRQDPRLKVLFQQFDRNLAALSKEEENTAEEEESDDEDVPDLSQIVDKELAELLHKYAVDEDGGGGGGAKDDDSE